MQAQRAPVPRGREAQAARRRTPRGGRVRLGTTGADDGPQDAPKARRRLCRRCGFGWRRVQLPHSPQLLRRAGSTASLKDLCSRRIRHQAGLQRESSAPSNMGVLSSSFVQPLSATSDPIMQYHGSRPPGSADRAITWSRCKAPSVVANAAMKPPSPGDCAAATAHTVPKTRACSGGAEASARSGHTETLPSSVHSRAPGEDVLLVAESISTKCLPAVGYDKRCCSTCGCQQVLFGEDICGVRWLAGKARVGWGRGRGGWLEYLCSATLLVMPGEQRGSRKRPAEAGGRIDPTQRLRIGGKQASHLRGQLCRTSPGRH